MNRLVYFSNCSITNKSYGGANGKKLPIEYNGTLYMLKFPSYAKKHPSMVYSNSVFSEDIGCRIFNLIGIDAQKTILGKYKVGNEYKEVVACEDFALFPWEAPYDFASLKNRVIDSSNNGYGMDLYDLLDAISKQDLFDVDYLVEYFWDMFTVDTLIGNWDRHNGNWGYLHNAQTDEVKLAPIFDCGSSLYPQLTDKHLAECLSDKKLLDFRVYERPTSALTINGSRINYYRFWHEMPNADAARALGRVLSKIDIQKIESLIHNTPAISNIRKEFYCVILNKRKELILDRAERLLNKVYASPFKELHQNEKNNEKQNSSPVKQKKVRSHNSELSR